MNDCGRALVISAHQGTREAIEKTLAGLEVQCVEMLGAAFEALERRACDLVVIESGLARAAETEDLARALPGTEVVVAGAETDLSRTLLGAAERARLGWSGRWRGVLSAVADAARSSVPVLLAGEIGTEVEAFARHLHLRRGSPWTPLRFVTCATEGADGALAALGARAGTVVLEDVAKLPRADQARLAAALGTPGAGARVIATVRLETGAGDPASLLATDLRARLGSIVEVPPLRARATDLMRLAGGLAATSARRLRKVVAGPSDEAVKALEAYPWPGNVLELGAVIERAVLLAPRETLEAADLGLPAAQAPPPGPAVPYDSYVREATAEAVRRYLVSLLERHRGNVSRAAREAGLERASCHRLLRRHKLDASDFRSV